MIYEWKKSSKRGQKGVGYVEVHRASVKSNNIHAVISFLPQYTNDEPKRKDVNVCLLFEGKKENLTKGLFHSIFQDIGEIVKNKEGEFFEGSQELRPMITQTLIVDKVSEMELISNGDYYIDNS